MEIQDDSRATSYTTLAAGSDFRHELEIRRSRFITVLRRSPDEDTARSWWPISAGNSTMPGTIALPSSSARTV